MPRKKVKDMPRKQQMAVKAAMAEKAAGKKSPTKMVSAKDNNAAIKEKKRKTRNKVKRVVQGIMTGGTSEVVRKLKSSAKKYMAQKTAKNAIKESMSEVAQQRGLKDSFKKRGLKDSLKGQKVKKRMLQKTLKRKTTEYDYENDDRGMDTNPIKPKSSALKMKTSPALAKLSASCKAAARRKFKVYPSAYANMWASRTQKKGKC